MRLLTMAQTAQDTPHLRPAPPPDERPPRVGDVAIRAVEVIPLWKAEAAGIGIMPGNHPITSVAAAATAHLCAAWSGPLIEGCFAENMAGEQADEIVCTPPSIEGGECIVPAGPGFGMVLDDAKIKRYRLDV